MNSLKYVYPPLTMEEYYTKYPDGHTIFESYIEVVNEVNHGVDVITQAVDHFNTQLDTTVENKVDEKTQDLTERLDNLITTPVPVGEIIAQEIIDARQGKGSVGANITEVKSQLAQTEQQLDDIFINVRSEGAVIDGVTDNTNLIQTVINQSPSNATIYIPRNTVYNLRDLNLPTGKMILDNSTGIPHRYMGFGGNAQFMFSFSRNRGGDNNGGRFNVFSEIATSGSLKYPLGHDLALIARGPADLRLVTMMAETTCNTSTVIGTQIITVGSTKDLASSEWGISLIVEPDGENQETIHPSNWSILDDTRLQVTFAKSHNAPFKVTQSGAVDIDTRVIGINRADVQDRPVQVRDRSNSPIMTLPNSLSGTFPKTAVKVRATITGDNGTNENLLFRNAKAESQTQFNNSSNTLTLLSISDTALTTNVPFRRLVGQQSTRPYSESIDIDASTGNMFFIAPTNGNAFTINAPLNPMIGQQITIQIINTFGTLGAITFTGGANGFRHAPWVQPANGRNRSITFQYNGGSWREISRTNEDIPN